MQRANRLVHKRPGRWNSIDEDIAGARPDDLAGHNAAYTAATTPTRTTGGISTSISCGGQASANGACRTGSHGATGHRGCDNRRNRRRMADQVTQSCCFGYR